MSSHHVIRDEQEPPVFIFSENFSLEILNDLLAWSPLVFVEHSLLKWFTARNIKVDGIIVLDETTDSDLADYKIFKFNKANLNLLSIIMHILGARAFTAINVFCDEEQHTDLIHALTLQDFSKLPFSLFVAHQKTIVLYKNNFVKWFPAKQLLKYEANVLVVSPELIHTEQGYETKQEGKHVFTTDRLPLIITEC